MAADPAPATVHRASAYTVRNTDMSEDYTYSAGTYGGAHITSLPPPPFPRQQQLNQVIEEDKIVWSAWDVLASRTVLLLGYAQGGLQIWDVHELEGIKEVLNLRADSSEIGVVRRAAVLKEHSGSQIGGRATLDNDALDEFIRHEPLLAILSSTPSSDERPNAIGNEEPRADLASLVIYSLATHEVLKRVPFNNAITFQAHESFLVISTIHPPTLHILSASTFNILHTISHNISFSEPVFSLSRRFLAYATLPPSERHAKISIRNQQQHQPASTPAQRQLEIATTARRVGEGVWGGMRALGGIALRAGVNAVAGVAASAAPGIEGDVHIDNRANHGPVFSRSAPAAPGGEHAQDHVWTGHRAVGRDPRAPTHSHSHSISGISPADRATPKHNAPSASQSPHWITVLDLGPLLRPQPSTSGSGTNPSKVAYFPHHSGAHTPLAMLAFNGSGTQLASCDTEGSVIKVWAIRPLPRTIASKAGSPKSEHVSMHPRSPPVSPRVTSPPLSPIESIGGLRPADQSVRSLDKSATQPQRTSNSSGKEDRGDGIGTAWHMYDLIRGVTRAHVESLCWSTDGRWLGVGSAKGTLHLFAINPYGGKPDRDSHLEGRVRNVLEMQPLSTSVSAITRFKPLKSTAGARAAHRSPLSFTFPSLSATSHSVLLRPTPPEPRTSHPRTTTTPPSPPSSSTKPFMAYQDLLIFNPTDRQLSLRRCTVRPVADSSTHSSPMKRSLALPGPAAAAVGGTMSGITSMMRGVAGAAEGDGLAGNDSLVAIWDIGRERDWPEVKEVLESDITVSDRKSLNKADWIAQAELSTSSRSNKMLPGPLYLSHQFSFYSFRKDWHALVRQIRFDLPTEKLEVRKEVEANQYYGDGDHADDTFMQSPPSARHGFGSFDEPLASAIRASLETKASPPVLPMFPNAYKAGSSWRDALPIRYAAGVSDGLGRLGRGMAVKVNNARTSPRPRHADPTTSPTPLRFDEDDEVLADEASEYPKHHEGDFDEESQESQSHSGASESVPSTTNIDSIEDDQWIPWAGDEGDHMHDTVPEEFTYDDIGAVGRMDEEVIRFTTPVAKHQKNNIFQ
ncbi:hypothetical protein BOTBODRAFT_58941 [Botryobasidium botryosum FD-172 SS1]|uniref:BCAS3 WD40 domain-containing protein n=1 Tax=Botryobasidium botryosum (strain FD-172 SS1) TaxID=930990 RepID=A0A067LZX5_BOTB1|nr:hypothetical protein BOTBODRAFT_58941 [Botryobasidium botryosum FD-172 SS1]